MNRWNEHIFTAELPYEKDAAVTRYLVENFHKVDDFVMSLGQMSNIPPSRLFQYENGKLVSEVTYIKNNYNASGLILYFYYIPKALLTVTYDLCRSFKRINFTCDIFFAQHFLPAFVAVILKKAGILKCNKIIFWMFDFFLIPPQITRSLYYRGIDLIQKFIRTNVDEMWYTTPRLAETDEINFGKLPDSVTKKITNGCFFERIPVKLTQKIRPVKLAFLGSLRPNNAIFESIDSVAYCLEKGINVELHIIGSGPYESKLKEYVKKKKISSSVIFHGFVDDGKKIAMILSKCHLGFALYSADAYGPNWFLTSGKFRRFVSQGLPIIATPVPYFAKYIYDYNAGFVIDNDPKEVYKCIKMVYDNPGILKTMKKGVDRLYMDYNTNVVFKKAFTSLTSDINSEQI